MFPMKLKLLPRSALQSNGDNEDQQRRRRRRIDVLLCRQDHEAMEREMLQESPRSMVIMPSLSYGSTDCSCATTSSDTTTHITHAHCIGQTTTSEDDRFSGSTETSFQSSTSICTQAESSVSSSNSEEAESNGENDDNSPWRNPIVPSPCLKIKTEKESLSRIYGCRNGTNSNSGKRALALLTALSTPSSFLSPHFSPPKHVQFSTVTVHFHALILGDNPSVSEGPPLMIDWKAFESIAYETVEDFQENKEPHEEPPRKNIPTEMHSVTIIPGAVTPRIPLPRSQKRKWPAHQRRRYLRNKLGVMGTDILRVEIQVRRIQLSRKAEVRAYAMEQLLSARQGDIKGFHAAPKSCNRARFVHGVSHVDDFALRGMYRVVEPPQRHTDADQYTYKCDSSLLDDDHDDGILLMHQDGGSSAKKKNNDDPTKLYDYDDATVPDACFSLPPGKTYTTTAMPPGGCWHPANAGKGWFILNSPPKIHCSTNRDEV